MKKNSRVPVALIVAALAAVLLVSAAMRARAVSLRELSLAETSLAAGDRAAAVVHARRAASWYAPGSAHDLAYAKLRSIAEEALARGDTELAVFAYRGIRKASWGSRSFLVPHAADRVHADAVAARVLSERDASLEKAGTRDLPERRLLGTFAPREGAAPGMMALIVLGFSLMVAGGVFLGAGGFDDNGRFSLRGARLGSTVVFAGLVAWLLGMWFA